MYAIRSYYGKLIAVSIDSHYTHLAWKNTPVEKGGLGNVQFPLVADLTKSIAKDYGVLLEGGVALRGSFLIDKDGVVRHQVVNDLPLGRNVDETIRMVDARITSYNVCYTKLLRLKLARCIKGTFRAKVLCHHMVLDCRVVLIIAH